MKPEYYGDKRDLIKWSVLFHLAETKKIKKICQIAYYRETIWPKVEVDKDMFEIPKEVLSVFRNIYSVKSMSSHEIKIEIFGEKFNDRHAYQNSVLERIRSEKAPAIIFLDPDTGLEPPSKKFKAEHVKESELKEIWNTMHAGSHLVLYQHETNKAGKEWIPAKKSQFAKCIGIGPSRIKIGRCNKIANDVVFFIIQK